MRERIERAFETWGHFVYRRAVLVIGVTLLGVGALASQLPNLKLDTSTEGFLHADDPIRTTYDDFRRQFGRDDMLMILVEPAGDIFELRFLEKLRAFHEAVESEVPKLKEVSSLIDARNTTAVGDELIVGELFEDWPETPEQLAVIREQALANPLYRNLLLSADGGLVSVLIETDAYSSLDADDDALAGFDDEARGDAAEPEPAFLTGEESEEIMAALETVMERFEAPDFRIHAAGSPVMVVQLQAMMRADMARFTGLAVASIAIFLAILFRRAAGVILPLVVVVASLVASLGTMALMGMNISLPSQILPSFLLAVGVGASVHVLAIFFQHQRRGHAKQDAIARAMGHSGLPVVMTSLTTAGGLVSFTTAELAPIADFGVIAPIGVMIALVITVVLLPALVAVFPIRQRADEARSSGLAPTQRALIRCGEFATAHAGAVVAATAGLVAIAILGAVQLRFSHNPLEWFPEDDPFRTAATLANERLEGSMFIEVLVDTGHENGLHEPDTLGRIDAMRRRATAIQLEDVYVGTAVSVVDVVKEIHQALNENRPEFRVIPQDRALVAQELLLFENSGSDDLEDVVDSQFSTGRMTMKLPFVDAIQYGPMLDRLQSEFEEILGAEAELTITGLMSVMGRTMTAVVESMSRSYTVALLVITPLMVLLIGNLRLGLLSMIPNLTPILLTLGLMGWAGFGLDAFTLLIGCIAIGLAVDDTIHFMHNFRRYYDASGDVSYAVRETLASTGQALLFTSLVLSTGFFLYTLARLEILFHFGLLTGFTILTAFLADVLLAPALMALALRRAPSPALQALQARELEVAR